jgi:hypothetical protein
MATLICDAALGIAALLAVFVAFVFAGLSASVHHQQHMRVKSMPRARRGLPHSDGQLMAFLDAVRNDVAIQETQAGQAEDDE